MFSTDFIFRQQENLVDNQKCQAGFRTLCNKILFNVLENRPWRLFNSEWNDISSGIVTLVHKILSGQAKSFAQIAHKMAARFAACYWMGDRMLVHCGEMWYHAEISVRRHLLQGHWTQIDAFQTNNFSLMDDILVKIQCFLESWNL